MSVQPPPLPSSRRGKKTVQRGGIPRVSVAGFCALVLFLGATAGIAFVLGVSATQFEANRPSSGSTVALDLGPPAQPDVRLPHEARAADDDLVALPLERDFDAPQAALAHDAREGPAPRFEDRPAAPPAAAVVLGREKPTVAEEDPPAKVETADNFPPCAAGQCAEDRSLGTALTWAKSPQDAAAEARRTGKLLVIIHVSGNFEQEDFT